MRVWEVSAAADPALPAAQALYETQFDPAERIPWAWIGRGLGADSRRRAGWWTHLVLAADDAGHLAGLFQGVSVRGFGGYASYLAVAPTHRRAGVATALYAALFVGMRATFAAWDEPLPFVVWDSHPPEPGDDTAVWRARLRLFERVGALWMSHAAFLAPNYADDAGPPVPLQLFLTPFDDPPPAPRAVMADLHRRVYRVADDDSLFVASQAGSTDARFVPTRDHPDFPREAGA